MLLLRIYAGIGVCPRRWQRFVTGVCRLLSTQVWTNVNVGAAIPPTAPQGVLVADRAIYKPGDAVRVKGYVRNVDPAALSVAMPTITAATVTVDWDRSNDGSSKKVR